jgi:hypothetical protein
MIYRGPGFLAIVWWRSLPPPPPLSRQQVVSLSKSSCVALVDLIDGRRGLIGLMVVGEDQVVGQRENLVLYKAFYTLCSFSKGFDWKCKIAYCIYVTLLWLNRLISSTTRLDLKSWFLLKSSSSLYTCNIHPWKGSLNFTYSLIGTGSRDRIQTYGQKWRVLGINKNLYGFLNFQNAPLMRCRHCHFPCHKGEDIWEK